MTFELRLAIVALAAFGAAGMAGSIAVSWIARRVVNRRAPDASTLLQLRLLPAVLSVLVCVLAVTAFERFEPRVGDERTGLILLACAAMAAAVLAGMVVRLWRAHRATGLALERWMRTARAISLPGLEIPAYAIHSSFPIVAVVGIARPRLMVATTVLAACSGEELDAILAHERSHVRRRDNARRVLMWSAPDVLMWTAFGRRLNDFWQTAAEASADADASHGEPARRLRLAEALIHVARLAPPGSSVEPMPASALYRGENIEQRVRRLLDPSADLDRARRGWNWLLISAGLVLPLSLLALRTIHELVEAAVAYLP